LPSILPPAERRSVILVMAYAALSLLLLVVGERIPTAGLRAVGALVFEPFDRITLAGDRALLAWRENEELHRRLTLLELQNRQLRGEQYENQRLRTQLGLPDSDLGNVERRRQAGGERWGRGHDERWPDRPRQ